MRRNLLEIALVVGCVALSGTAFSQNGPFVAKDLSKESLTINEQYFARVMGDSQGLLSKDGFLYLNLLLSPPGGDQFWVGADLAVSVPLIEIDFPVFGTFAVGWNSTTQIYTIPRVDPREAARRAGRTYAVDGLVSFDEQTGLNLATGFDFIDPESGSFLQIGANYSTELDIVESAISPYLFTNIEVISGLRALFDLGISPNGASLVPRVAGGLNYRFSELMPVLSEFGGGDLEMGFTVLRSRQILANETNMAAQIVYYPKINAAEKVDESGNASLMIEDSLSIQGGRLSLDYDGDIEPSEAYEEEGFYVKAEARYRIITLGVSAVPKTGLGWYVGLDAGVLGLSVQKDYLLNTLYNTALTGTTFFFFYKMPQLFQ